MCTITIFTPTYNRAPLLSKLFDSLKAMTSQDFEWLVIDDGSVDNTQEIVNKMIEEKNDFSIRYFKQQNGGKHRAINKGIELADGELFFIVDSDDILPTNTIQIIKEKYQKIKGLNNIAGVSGRKAYFDGTYIGTAEKYDDKIESSLDFRFKSKIKGDMAEVFITDILRNYKFPEFSNERFCPEALVFNRIALQYKMLWFSDKIYFAEYLPDGLTSKIFEIRRNSPEASMLYYSELSKMDIPFIQRIKAISNFWRFSIYSNKNLVDKIKMVSFSVSMVSMPISILLIIRDKWV